MNETLSPCSPSADLDSCTRDQMSVAAFFQAVKDQKNLYDPEELVPAIAMKLREIDQAIMNPGSVTIPQDLPHTIRKSLPEHLRSAFDTELRRLEIRKIQSQLSRLGKELEDSFEGRTGRELQTPPAPKENPSLRTVIKNVFTNVQVELIHDHSVFTTFDTADQLKEGVRIAFSWLKQKLSFRSRANVPLPMPQ